ncbi:RNA-binding protein [Alkalibaculum sp. M08DMB]|uniref:RNA-binding protein n=1 Tax=Alkalibaculum sporogenes TaxID=2655001 RepID=A0A6A7K7G1_9FIRM|nr:RNA-binding S4 domain-containing protein [Alkalibaculum sporogenes]MPW25325.1 RNA-binding protein [Alkalibaculum sporogenes]
MEIIIINTDYIKLDQLLKFAGVVESGAVAKHTILEGLVKVNDELCLQRGKKVYPDDTVFLKDYGSFIVKKE